MIEFPVVLVINCGSSSVKFSVLDASSCDALMTGIADGINTEKAFISVNGGEPARLAHQDYEGALAAIALELEKRNLMSSVALIGHRIAHGGNLFSESTLITEEAIAQIRQVSPLAPLHNYANLSGVEAAERLFPGVQQVAVFDTSFHQTLPPQAYLYGLPYRYFEELGVRRYGFHGTSHDYVTGEAARFLGVERDSFDAVVAHLGNGASATAIRDGASYDTSMGYTPLAGLIMGTRTGDLDPSIVTALLERYPDLDAQRLDQIMNKESGLKALAGHSDMRTVDERAQAGDQRAELALEMTAYRLAKYIGGYHVAVGGAQALIFTAGIGENSAGFRQRVVDKLGALGAELDPEANAVRGDEVRRISTPESHLEILVVPTDEERAIAEATAALVSRRAS